MAQTSKRSRIALGVGAAVAAGGLVYYLASKPPKPTLEKPPQSVSAPATFHGIPPEGTGGDPDLNRRKNRWVEPQSFRDMSVQQIMSFAHDKLDAAGREMRARWPSAATAQAASSEGLGVRVEGYLVAAKASGPESCNGESTVYHDDHVWLAASGSDAKTDAIIVEVTPFWNERHPEWDLKALLDLVRRHTKVRISGWVLWDQEHADEVGKSRGSQWEVHPITKIEVFGGGAWHDLGASPLP